MGATLPDNGRPFGRENDIESRVDNSDQVPFSGQILGWTGFIRVDGTSYTWMGAPAPSPTLVTQTSYEYTSTRSTFVMDVGGLVTMNITFLSPVNPTDFMRQSLTFSYVEVAIASSDGGNHDVQLYTDITAGWSLQIAYVVLFQS